MGTVLKDSFVSMSSPWLLETSPTHTYYNTFEFKHQDALESPRVANFLDKYSSEAASLEDKMTIKMNKMMNEMKALVVTTPAPVKAVEEVKSSLLKQRRNSEIAITTVNAECSAIIMNKVPEKLEDPGKFLIPCALQELNRTSALADSGASINLLPHSIYKKLELEALTPTRMTLEWLPSGRIFSIQMRHSFLDRSTSDDDSHNLASKVTSDHEPEQNESSITFSPRSDPLHHKFAGEPLTLPARNDRESEE
ncbi:reverse transcriptase domain-containing protein [Tanacetum coccineum]